MRRNVYPCPAALREGEPPDLPPLDRSPLRALAAFLVILGLVFLGSLAGVR